MGPAKGGRTGSSSPDCLSRGPLRPCAPSLLSSPPRPTTTCIASIPTLFYPARSSPPLQSGSTPLHAAAASGSAPVVALLLATPGADPLATDWVRGAQRRLRGPLVCPTPLLAAAGWRDSAERGAEEWKCRRSRTAAGGPACCSGARSRRKGLSRVVHKGVGSHRSGAASVCPEYLESNVVCSSSGAAPHSLVRLLPSLNSSSRTSAAALPADSSDLMSVHPQPLASSLNSAAEPPAQVGGNKWQWGRRLPVALKMDPPALHAPRSRPCVEPVATGRATSQPEWQLSQGWRAGIATMGRRRKPGLKRRRGLIPLLWCYVLTPRLAAGCRLPAARRVRSPPRSKIDGRRFGVSY